MSRDPAIDEIRRVRHEISVACHHDPKELLARYRELQQDFVERVVNYGAEPGVDSTSKMPGRVEEPVVRFDELALPGARVVEQAPLK